MNLENIRKNVIDTAHQKLVRHKNLGSQSSLSISQVAELLDIVHGMAEEARVSPHDLVGNISLN